MTKNIKIAIGVVVTLLLLSTITGVYNTSKDLYNKSKQLELSYNKIEQQQIVTWDSYYLNFKEQSENVKINKEGFMELATIVMYARKDGQNVAWKWVQENTQIPFEEFTVFYKQLSGFISVKYTENLNIENQKLTIVQEQNLLISTFPNNIYSSFLNINKLNYKVGFLSQDTKNKFK